MLKFKPVSWSTTELWSRNSVANASDFLLVT